MSIQKTLTPKATFELTLLALIWGGSFLAIRIALDEIPVFTSVAWRVVPAALVLWGWAAFKGHAFPRGWRIWGAFLVMGALNNVIPFTLMTWAQLYIETGLTSILNSFTAIFGVLLAALAFRDERLSFRKSIGVLLGFGGVVMAIGPEALANFDLRSLAQVAVLGGTLSYACAGLWARTTMAGLAPETAAAGMLTGSSLFLVPLALIADGAPSFSLDPKTWLAMAYYAFAATALAYLLYYRVLAMAGSANLLFVTLMIPPVAIVLGASVRGETLPPSAFLGLALLTVGLAILDGRILKRFRNASET